MIARVEPLTRTRAVHGPFDYTVPESMAAEVGERDRLYEQAVDVATGLRRGGEHARTQP
jgi:hypothetical protein